MGTMRRRTTAQLLQALRTTQPHPLMVSSLDFEPQEYHEEVLEMEEDEAPQQTQYCESCQEMTASNQHLVLELQRLRSKYMTLHRKYTLHMKSCRSVSQKFVILLSFVNNMFLSAPKKVLCEQVAIEHFLKSVF